MDNLIGKKLDDRYELIELIGAGGMADIYKAKDITENKIVAVKILKNEFAGSEDFLRRFRNESKAIALLSHPNIVKIFDVGFSDQIQFIVMEYIDGITLTEYIKLQGVLKWKDAVFFTVQILRALQHAHDRGIVHRDIKSQNVMMLPDGTIKVMDFGIARFNRESDKTLSEKTIGSVHYISPEQARGEMTDEKSDIYSVGVMLYEMLTGQKPFDGDTPVSIALQHMQTQPKMLRDINSSIPEGLEEITLKAMQKEPSARYQTAGEMINDIEEFKKDPSIVFEYKYFTPEGATKYFDKVNNEKIENNDADDDLYDEEDDDDEIEERRSPLLPILFAVASVFVIMTAWLIFTIVTNSIPSTSAASDEIVMPQLIGMNYEDAKSTYPNINFEVTRKYSTEYAEMVIMDQGTAAGRVIKATSIVNIVVSNGPEKVEIMDYSQLTGEDAKIKLTKAGLKVKTILVEDKDVVSGYVIKTDPAKHSLVDQGTEVRLYVSNGSGAKSVSVPKFVGMTYEEALKVAEEKKLVLKRVDGPNNEYQEGEIFKQTPIDNTVVNQETEIEVWVCDGTTEDIEYEFQFKIPDNVGDTGSFYFNYYIDGVVLEDETEKRDMSVNSGKLVKHKFIGSKEVNLIIKIVNTEDESLNGILLEANIDFTKKPVEEDILEYHEDLFKKLKYTAPETTVTDPPVITTPAPVTTTPAPVTTPAPETPAPVTDNSEPASTPESGENSEETNV